MGNPYQLPSKLILPPGVNPNKVQQLRDDQIQNQVPTQRLMVISSPNPEDPTTKLSVSVEISLVTPEIIFRVLETGKVMKFGPDKVFEYVKSRGGFPVKEVINQMINPGSPSIEEVKEDEV